jgi:hypothetical protein
MWIQQQQEILDYWQLYHRPHPLFGAQDSGFLQLLPVLKRPTSIYREWTKPSLYTDVTNIQVDDNTEKLAHTWLDENMNVLAELNDVSENDKMQQKTSTNNLWTNRVFINQGGTKRRLPLTFTTLKDVYVCGPILLDNLCDHTHTIDLIVFSPKTSLQSILDTFSTHHTFVQKKQSKTGETVWIHTVSSTYNCCILFCDQSYTREQWLFQQLIDIDAALYHPYSDTWCYLTRAWLANLTRSNIVHPVQVMTRQHVKGWRQYKQTFNILVPGFHKTRIDSKYLLCLKSPPEDKNGDDETQAQIVDFFQQYDYNDIEPLTQEMLSVWNEQCKQHPYLHFYSLAYNCL